MLEGRQFVQGGRAGGIVTYRRAGMRTRTLLAALLAAAVPAAGATPAQAGGRGHQLRLYKVDKHIDIAGEEDVTAIRCRRGDILLDGMWRIDGTDRDFDYEPEPPPGFASTGDSHADMLRSVLPVRAEATTINRFSVAFLALGGGDISGKLFATCMRTKTNRVSGHHHSWTVGPLVTDPPVPAATPMTAATSSACGPDELQIAPGFAWTGDSYGNPVKRWPASPASLTRWDWRFVTDSAGGSVALSHRCLNRRTQVAGGHRHRLTRQFRSRAETLVRGLSTVASECGQIYKAALGAWDLGGFAAFDELWFLGMDPRPKIRAYRLLNDDGASRTAEFGAVCIKDRV